MLCVREQGLLTLLQAPTGGQQQQQQQQQQAQQAQQGATADEGPKENSNPAAAAAAGGNGSDGVGKSEEAQTAGTGCEQAAAQPAQPAKRPRLALRK